MFTCGITRDRFTKEFRGFYVNTCNGLWHFHLNCIFIWVVFSFELYFMTFSQKTIVTMASLFIIAAAPVLHDIAKDNNENATYRFTDLRPSSQFGLHECTQLMYTFLSRTKKTSRTLHLSTQRWIIAAIYYTLLSSPGKMSTIVNKNSFFATKLA